MSRSKVYKTNMVILTGFCVLYFLTGKLILLLPAILVFSVSIVSFKGAYFIAEKWMLVGKTIGTFNAKVLLSIVYFTVLLPTGLIKKLIIHKKSQKKSNWKTSKPIADDDFFRPF